MSVKIVGEAKNRVKEKARLWPGFCMCGWCFCLKQFLEADQALHFIQRCLS